MSRITRDDEFPPRDSGHKSREMRCCDGHKNVMHWAGSAIFLANKAAAYCYCSLYDHFDTCCRQLMPIFVVVSVARSFACPGSGPALTVSG